MRRLSLLLLPLFFLLLLLFLFRAPLLRTAAEVWIVDHRPLTRVDALIVPGGGIANRPRGAADLYLQDLAPRLVIFDVFSSPDEELGITPSQEERSRRLLDAYSVPSDAIITIGSSVASTWDEVLATREWCRDNQIRSLAIITDPFPSRRVQWAYRKGFRQADLDTEIHIIPIDPPRYRTDTWWQDEAGLIAFQNEVIKLFYYMLKY